MTRDLQFLIYSTPQEDIKVDVVAKDETLWLTQKALAALFGVQVPAISKHLKNIFEEGELDEQVVVSNLETTTAHGAIPGKTQKINELLQPGCRHLGWLPGQLGQGHAVQNLGDEDAEGVHPEGLPAG